MLVSSIYDSIQGEGRYVGLPVTFVRLSGCNLDCEWCDTDYERKTDMSIEGVVSSINRKQVVWTGGEPTLQLDGILKVIKNLEYEVRKDEMHHLETNGTILNPSLKEFDYIAFSPKNKEDLDKLVDWLRKQMFDIGLENQFLWDIKIVTDLEEVGVNMLKEATMLMPLTSEDKQETIENKKRVWNYCKKNNKRYSPRIQEIWGFGANGV